MKFYWLVRSGIFVRLAGGMLRIGVNEYELVRANSGFTVSVQEKNADVLAREQVWKLEAHYVPRENQYTPRPDGTLEYLVVTLQSEEYAVQDWQKLSGLGLVAEAETWFGHAFVENLLVGRYEQESWKVIPAWLEVQMLQDYLFHCEFHGYRELDDGTEEEMEFEDDIPFSEAAVYVPVNAPNPVAAAQAMARRVVGLTEFAGNRVLHYDPKRSTFLGIRLNTHHLVTLQTPWRLHLV